MKTKLLKKIRKKFNWYINQNGFPVLINHSKKSVDIINMDYYSKYFNYNNVEEAKKSLEVTEQTCCWRLMISIMFKPFGYTYADCLYNYAVRKEKNEKTEVKNEKTEVKNEKTI